MSDAACMFWYDLETTGTEKQYDEIIEIGVVLTDFEFNVIGEPKNWIIEPNEAALGRLMKNEVVRNMHLQNNLLEDILNPDLVMDLGEVIAAVNEYLDETIGPKKKVMPCGSGIGHFDNKFMEWRMPAVHDRFTRQYVDIGVVRRFIKMCGVAEPSTVQGDPKNHRALDDALLHLEEARTFRDRFQESLKPRMNINIVPSPTPIGATYIPGGIAHTPTTVVVPAKPVKSWNDQTPRH